MDFIKRKSISKVKFKRAIKNAVDSYTKLVDKLKDYGITKKEELTGSLGEYYCKELFGVKLTKNFNEKGFDGYYKNKKIEIKSRTWNSPYFTFSKSKLTQFDWAFLVIFDENYNLADIFAVSKSIIKNKIPKGGTFNLSNQLIDMNPRGIKHIYQNTKYSEF